MAKKKSRLIAPATWLKSATPKQEEEMLQCLVKEADFVPVKTPIDVDRAYTLVKAKNRGPVDAWELVIFRIKDGRLEEIKRFPENLRDVIFRDIEDDILRDA